MANKTAEQFYTVEKEINGTVYKAQFSGLSCALNSVDSSYIDGSNNLSTLKMSNYVLKNIIVEPQGLDVDSFDDIEELNEVVAFGKEVMQGKFRNKVNKVTTKEKGN